MKIEVGKTYQYDPKHKRCCFVTTSIVFIYEVNVTAIENDVVHYIYSTGFKSHQDISNFILALTPLTTLEEELY
jgi:hypothetical protein